VRDREKSHREKGRGRTVKGDQRRKSIKNAGPSFALEGGESRRETIPVIVRGDTSRETVREREKRGTVPRGGKICHMLTCSFLLGAGLGDLVRLIRGKIIRSLNSNLFREGRRKESGNELGRGPTTHSSLIVKRQLKMASESGEIKSTATSAHRKNRDCPEERKCKRRNTIQASSRGDYPGKNIAAGCNRKKCHHPQENS